MDIENLSKTNLYKDAFVQKENRMPTQTDQQMSNPAKNLLTSIAEAKQCVESLRSTVFSVSYCIDELLTYQKGGDTT